MLAQSQGTPPISKRDPIRILLVEDDDVDANIIEFVAGMMSEFVLSIHLASDLDAARRALTQQEFDIIFVDYWLDNGTSMKLLPYIDEMRPRTGAIVISNLHRSEVERMNLCSNGTVFLSKANLSADSLEHAIRAVLERQSLLPN